MQFPWIQRKLQKNNSQFVALLPSNDPSNLLFSNSESFKYKTSITGNTYNVGDGETGHDANKAGKNKTEIVISLKHLSNFWRTLNI